MTTAEQQRASTGSGEAGPLTGAIVMTVGLILTGFAVAAANGVFGGPGSIGAEESIASTPTLLGPAGTAFSIWSLIYLGLLAFTVWLWLPSGRRSVRATDIRWLAFASLLLNAGWILVTRLDWVWVAVAVIAVLLLALIAIVKLLADTPPHNAAEVVLVDWVFGLYLGWVSVAVVANITQALVNSDVTAAGPLDTVLAIVLLVVVGAIAFLITATVRFAVPVLLAMAWGTAWIGAARFGEEVPSTVVGVVAYAVAAAILVLAVARIAGGEYRRYGKPATPVGPAASPTP